ncbi:antitoxin HicB [Plantibacter sp. Mn2098]|uniref:antitoxin HicB n=1 Tax=Plantibacter sp. Mn2098 TaxID=3395266 RepID=UPI003BCD258A
MSSTIEVTATRWEGGWELAIDDDPVTQVRTLDRAAQQVRDYLDTAEPNIDHSDVEVRIHAELDGNLGRRIQETRAATLEAHERQMEAARQARLVVRELRAAHVSVADAAALLGVSRGRVSQLVKETA